MRFAQINAYILRTKGLHDFQIIKISDTGLILHPKMKIWSFITYPQNAFTLLYQPGHKGALFAFKSERKSMKKTHSCVEADIE